MTSAEFEQTLFASDFDNTIARTSEPPTSGMTVEQAYMRSVYNVLGPGAFRKYLSEGGLRNRSPLEVVKDLQPELSDDLTRQRTENLVAKKLEILLPQFGSRLPDGQFWPKPVEGAVAVWQQLHNEASVNTAVISSGHNEAIQRFFDIHELPQPDVMVTDDDMRPLTGIISTELITKPGRLLIDIAHQRWLELHGQGPLINTDPEAFWQSRNRITYAGDDPRKDGQMASLAGVEFVHVPIDNPAPAWHKIGQLLIPKALAEVMSDE